MSLKSLPQIATIAATLVVSVLLTACATTGVVPAQKLTPDQLQKRATERSTARWKALTDKRFSDAFGFLSEASRASVSAIEYEAAMKRMGYLAATVESANCDDSICNVKMIVMLPIFVRGVGARAQNVPVEEQWILNGGELWLIRR